MHKNFHQNLTENRCHSWKSENHCQSVERKISRLPLSLHTASIVGLHVAIKVLRRQHGCPQVRQLKTVMHADAILQLARHSLDLLYTDST